MFSKYNFNEVSFLHNEWLKVLKCHRDKENQDEAFIWPYIPKVIFNKSHFLWLGEIHGTD